MKTVRFLHCENAYDSYQEPPHLLSWKRVMWEKRAKNPIRTYYVAFATLLWLRATNAARHDLADYRMHIPSSVEPVARGISRKATPVLGRLADLGAILAA
jgi:hypothetical protein